MGEMYLFIYLVYILFWFEMVIEGLFVSYRTKKEVGNTGYHS